MDILLCEFQAKARPILESLSRHRDVSIYLSLSREDTLRIIRDVKPSAIIFFRRDAQDGQQIRNLCAVYPDIGIYSCPRAWKPEHDLTLTNLRDKSKVSLEAIVNE